MQTVKRITKKQLFIKTVEIAQPLIGLSEWKIAIRFPSKMKGAADCQAYPEYKQAAIRANLMVCRRLSHYEIIETAIHEMVHCLLWPIVTWTEELCRKNPQKIEITRKLEESTVTEFEKLLTKLCIDAIQLELAAQGFEKVPETFATVQVVGPPKKKIKK
jgi:hypothetical protein